MGSPISCQTDMMLSEAKELTHWGRVTHLCVSNQTIIGSDNGLSPGRRQAIIWTNAGILLIGPLGTNFSENLIEILTFLFTKMRLKVLSAKWRPFCLGLNVLIYQYWGGNNPMIMNGSVVFVYIITKGSCVDSGSLHLSLVGSRFTTILHCLQEGTKLTITQQGLAPCLYQQLHARLI